MDAQTTKDPFDLLLNAGSNPETWLLIVGPIGLVLLITVVYAIVIMIRNRREREALRAEVEKMPGGAEVAAALDRGTFAGDDNDAEPATLASPSPRPQLRAVPKPPPSEAPAKLASETAPPPLSSGLASSAGTASTDSGSDIDEVRRTDRRSWLARLQQGLARTRQGLRQSLETLFTGKTRLDEQLLEDLHATLYRADIGVAAADKLVDHVRLTIGKENAANPDAVSQALRERAKSILLEPTAVPLNRPAAGPWVILVVGVNGVGKTTTIGKLGAHFLAADQQVLFGAADTFRAAAIEQLSVWGERLGVDVVKHKQGSDPAAVAYDAVKAAVARAINVLLIDTAGRLHAKQELMDELGKINRIIGRDLPGAPHETWLVIDATTGQNAVMQVKAFSQVVKLTGLIVTKLDGTAKGGVVLSIVEQFKLPIRFVGVGEKAADLRAFDPADFADSLF